jgi:hypothetical protein
MENNIFSKTINEAKILNENLKSISSAFILNPADIIIQYENLKNMVTFLKKQYLATELILNETTNNVERYAREYKNILNVVENDDTANLKILNTYIQQNVKLHDTKDNNKYDIVELAPKIPIQCVLINNSSLVPETPLYYIKNTNEFVINIAGTILRGNIRELLPPKIKSTTISQLKSTNFLYVPHGKGGVRRVGNRNTLLSEITTMTPKEKIHRKIQTMHDVLIMIAIGSL